MELLTDLINVRSYADIYTVAESKVLQLCGADHFALGCANLDASGGLQWTTRTVRALLDGYPQWFKRCFVFKATWFQPNCVLNDVQMNRGQALERTETRQRSIAAGLDLRHVLAALLVDKSRRIKAGLAVYSEGEKPFALRNQWKLQELTPAFSGAVSSVQYLHSVRFERDLLKAVSTAPGATMVVNAAGRERVRTDAATPLLTKWFPRNEQASDGVPKVWVERVTALANRDGVPQPGSIDMPPNANGETLHVTFTPSTVIEPGLLTWQVRILERSHGLREDWLQMLTRKEREVAKYMLRGDTDRSIGLTLRIDKETVKRHGRHIRRKTGALNRKDFIARGRRS
ncbi:helix-turn-helix transcriptional regulator [Corallococcus sp. ZKHCc1 1396]|uniref:Helix-turn-helix transcriptional regulator n=1 Tax=Corallococcus soli TaxID=2710757 RepID=A0ABR9PJC4_9BACT|nr:helix-turn-helix transcriptional regulator [Corallococcus soli]MBE4748032.1 helix-turn-helix transcriptional regulator [Corallococcus soli]